MGNLERWGQYARLVRARALAWCTRHRRAVVAVAAVVGLAIVVVVGETVNLAAATFVLVLYTALLSAITAIGWRPLEALPSLKVGLWSDGELVTGYVRELSRMVAPIDIDACVRNAVRPIRGEIPPEIPAALGLAAFGVLTNINKETRSNAVGRLESELETYEAELREWLEEYDKRRWPTYAKIETKIAIRNSGETSANGVILRVKLPKAMAPMDGEHLAAIEMPAPPRAPKYEERTFGFSVDPLILPRQPVVMPSIPIPRAASSGPRYVQDAGHNVAEVRLDEVTHGVTELSDRVLAVLPTKPGVYDLEWEAHVSNLRRPARGSIRVEVRPLPVGGPPLRTVDDILRAGDVVIAEP